MKSQRRMSAHIPKNVDVQDGYQVWRRARVSDITGPYGKASISGNGQVSGKQKRTFGGIPGCWSTSADGTLVVTAGAEDELRVNGRQVIGTLDVPTGRVLEFSAGRTGEVDTMAGGYSLVFFDPAALEASGVDRIEPYPFDPRWVVQAELRAAPPGRTAEVERLSNPRSAHVVPAPFDLAVTIEGIEYVLTVVEASAGVRMVVFTDTTSGGRTPDIGRWLTLSTEAVPGPLRIDFNRATLSYHHLNPSLFHCPLSPQGNHLPIPVEAGEHTLLYTQVR